MSRILLITYTPRFESNTAKLVDTFIETMDKRSDITHLDLVKKPAPFLLEDNLNALLKRNFMGMKLTESENKAVESTDVLVQQLQETDQIVMAFPMYNFSVPATIKAWFDAVIQNGKTFKTTDEGGYEGLCQGKRSLILMSTGGDFSVVPAKSMNYATPLAEACMGFMDIESHSITAYGLNQYMDRANKIVADTQQEIKSYLNEQWMR